MKAIKLILLIALCWWLYATYMQPQTIEVPTIGRAKVTLNADSIRAICEMAGASQRVTVLFDTAWIVDKSIRALGITLLERNERQEYRESRTWLIKAGVQDVEIEDNSIILSAPILLSASEIEKEFRVLKNTGDSWNPVSVHAHVSRSRALAEAKSKRMGILGRAKVSIDGALKQLIKETDYKIIWE